MKTVAVLDLVPATGLAFEPFAGGPSAFERSLAALRSLPGLERVVVLASGLEPPPGDYELVRRASWDVPAFIEALGAIAGDPMATGAPGLLVHAFGDQPFLDGAFASAMAASFERWKAEYLFADGWPEGFTAEFVKPRILMALSAIASREKLPFSRDALFLTVQKDINSFDVETEISRVDLRPWRFRAVCDTRRDFEASARLAAVGIVSAESVQDLLPAHEEVLRNRPAFIHVQVSGACPHACAYCPYPGFGGDVTARRDFMEASRFDAFMEKVAEFSGDAVVDLSLWGEPALHPDFGALAESVLSRPRLSLIVETSGAGWRPGVVEGIAERHADSGRIDWIVSLDETEADAYASLRGPGFAEAVAFAERLGSIFPGRVHAQAVRMRENELHLESFWRGWKEKGLDVIIQKYDAFAGRLPDRTVSDLAPLRRLPCRHLARDLVVVLDGSVLMCREVLAPGACPESAPLGNVFEDALEAIWAKGEAAWRAHVERKLPAICERCDEYHTWNA
ncbi:MAG: spiro-SPASM protein [Spirochaetales bacterium]|nr:spiro-SPASM protein [Spirochaetales bacterium]